MTLGERFDSGPNALNFLRLCLALEVICWHSYAIPRGHPPARIWSDVGVDGFFVISGFLIVRSWQRSTPTRYLLARAKRIMPGLAVCLVVTAFMFAPMVGSPVLHDQTAYVLSGLRFGTHWGISGSLAEWNGSLWSLRYEVACYVAVAVLGLLRVLRPAVLAVFAVMLLVVTVELHASGAAYMPTIPWLSLRCALMFALGGCAWMFRDRIPLDGRLAVLAAVLLVVSSPLADYRTTGAVPLAYLLLWAGVTLGRFPRLVLTQDLSYGTYIYAFPVQQLLLAAGVSLWWPGFVVVSVACILPLAAASWWLVEKPVLRRQTSAAWAAIRVPESAVP